jgi:hypothetical protein
VGFDFGCGKNSSSQRWYIISGISIGFISFSCSAMHNWRLSFLTPQEQCVASIVSRKMKEAASLGGLFHLQVVIAVVLREHSKQPQHDKQAEWYAQQPQDHRHRRLRCFDGELTRYVTLGSRRLSNQSRTRADVWSKEGQARVRAGARADGY